MLVEDGRRSLFFRKTRFKTGSKFGRYIKQVTHRYFLSGKGGTGRVEVVSQLDIHV